MKMSIPYEKEIVFNTKIAEITSISLEYEANVLDDDIEGEFIVSGDYKIHELSVNKEPFKYRIPFSVSLTDDIKKLLSLTDLVLLDIKHIDSEKFKNLVGFNNEKELAFARYLSDNNIHMWIRQVLVPGYTDDEQDLLQLKGFIDSLNTVDKIEVLPYHDMGKYKWEKLGLKYQLDGVRVANDDDVIRAKKLLGIT